MRDDKYQRYEIIIKDGTNNQYTYYLYSYTYNNGTYFLIIIHGTSKKLDKKWSLITQDVVGVSLPNWETLFEGHNTSDVNKMRRRNLNVKYYNQCTRKTNLYS